MVCQNQKMVRQNQEMVRHKTDSEFRHGRRISVIIRTLGSVMVHENVTHIEQMTHHSERPIIRLTIDSCIIMDIGINVQTDVKVFPAYLGVIELVLKENKKSY